MSEVVRIDGRLTWTPARVAQLRALAAKGMSDAQSAKLMGVSRSAIAGVRHRFRIAGGNPSNGRLPIPEDFATRAADMTVHEACEHYATRPSTMRAWYKIFGITPIRRRVAPKAPKAPKEPKPHALAASFAPSYRAPRRKGNNSPHRQFCLPERDATRAGAAQRYLQRFGPVIRARTIDQRAPADQWIVMGRRLSESEMLAAAERKGWAA